jgi:DNA-directed RNA polymerase subunit RPC12/RpoP
MPIIPILILIGLLVVLPILVIWHARTHSYICKNCGFIFSISILKDFISPHRYLKCPKCNKWAWQKEIKNKNIK